VSRIIIDISGAKSKKQRPRNALFQWAPRTATREWLPFATGGSARRCQNAR